MVAVRALELKLCVLEAILQAVHPTDILKSTSDGVLVVDPCFKSYAHEAFLDVVAHVVRPELPAHSSQDAKGMLRRMPSCAPQGSQQCAMQRASCSTPAVHAMHFQRMLTPLARCAAYMYTQTYWYVVLCAHARYADRLTQSADKSHVFACVRAPPYMIYIDA